MDSKNKSKEDLLQELDQLHTRIAELETAQKRCQDIVSNANSIILCMDTEGKITFFNNFAQRFFGYHEDEIIGKSVIGTIVSEKDLSGSDLVRMISDIVNNPERYSINENENTRSNGERVWVAWTNKAIIDQDGTIREILCIGNDITKFKNRS